MKYFEDFENNFFEQIRVFYENEPTYGRSEFKNGWYDIVLEYGFSGDEEKLIYNYNDTILSTTLKGYFSNLTNQEKRKFAVAYVRVNEKLSLKNLRDAHNYDENLIVKNIEKRFKEWVAYYFNLQALFDGVYDDDDEDYDSMINLPNEYSSVEAILFYRVKKELKKLPPVISDDFDNGWDDLVAQYGFGGEEYLYVTNEYETVLIQSFKDNFNALNQEDQEILKNDYSNNNEKSSSIPNEIIISEIVGRFKLWIEDNYNVDDLDRDEEDEDEDAEDQDAEDQDDFEAETEINKFDNNTTSFEEYNDNPNQLKLLKSKQIILFVGGISTGDEYKVKSLVYEIGFTDDVLIKTRKAMPTRNLYAGFFESKEGEDCMYILKEKLYQTFKANNIGMVDFFMIDATVSPMYKSIWHDGLH